MNGKDENRSSEPLLEPLTRREQNILAHLANDRSSKEIAVLESLSYTSVKWYIHQVYAKLGVNSRSEAITRARELGLLQPDPAAQDKILTVKNNLPAELTRFFGREADILQVKERLVEYRLVTLTGSGGVGKTRLSLAAAEKVLADFPDGVWFVEMAPLSDPEMVAQTAASAIGMHEEAGLSILERLKSFLASRASLLVLDNCEHLLEACARLADNLLHACPRLKILASSREPLGVTGEAIFRVPSLPFPAPGQAVIPESIDSYAAVRLFVDRARMALPDFQVTAQNASAVAGICQRLDGIPLAIELAAARMNALTAEELNARLDNVFRLLTGGSRAALPRQQTLRATIDWSYRLLSDQESLLLRRLATFAGGWDLPGAEGVCAGTGLEPSEILELLANLVNKSMVNASHTSRGRTRYHMLETIHQYAREKLADCGDLAAFQHRHLAYFAELADTMEPQARGPRQNEWQRRFEDDLENIRLALATGLKADPPTGLRLASALWQFWGVTGRYMEGLRWLRVYLDHPENAARTALRGHALWKIPYLFSINPGSEDSAQESLDIFREINDLPGQGCAQWSLGECALYHEDLSTARLHLDAAREIFKQLQEHWWLAQTQFSLALTARYQGDVAALLAYFEKALVLFQDIGDQRQTANALYLLGEGTYLFWGDLRRGYAMMVEAQAIFTQNDYGKVGDYRLAEVLCLQGEYERVSKICGEMWDLAHQSNDDDYYVPATNLYIGRLTCLQGRLEAGIDLLEQGVKSFEESLSLNYLLAYQQTFEMELAYAHACLGQIERAESLVVEFGHFFREAQYQPRLMNLLGFLAFRKGEAKEAARCYRESLRLADQMQWRLDALLALEGYAWSLQLNARPTEAARLLGAAAEFRTRIGAPVFPRDRPVYDQVIAALKASLGEAEYATAWADGQALGFERACSQG